jgi:choline dehydrogenase
MGESFDYIVVGAGSAGCVLAGRLSEDKDARVLVLEAGGNAWMPLYRVPFLAGILYRYPYNNWAYWTEPEPQLDNRSSYWPRGKVVGGSHRINGMVYTRGHRLDYDTWRQMGNEGWGYDDVLPYFKKSEDFAGPDVPHHGKGGPLTVGVGTGSDPLFDALLEAGREAGYPVVDDFNDPEREGFGRFHFTIRNGQRWTTADAFLKPALARPNLVLRARCMTTRVLLDRGRAVGIEYIRNGRRVEVRAEREVILAGGAINSPAVLLNSGIGPATHLREVGVKVAHDLPGVGENLHDHVTARVQFACVGSVGVYDQLRVDRAARHVLGALVLRRGMGTAFPLQVGFFLRSRPELAAPDLQLNFIPTMWPKAYLPFQRRTPQRRPGFNAGVHQAQPESRGWIRLRSADPLARPRIFANYLATENDRRTLREGVKIVRDVMRRPAMARHIAEEVAPGPNAKSDSEIDAWIRATADTVFHPVGTCKMGTDPMAVVDPRLKVHGIAGLRVADASIMPVINASNTNAPTIMIAEKAADMIRADAARP